MSQSYVLKHVLTCPIMGSHGYIFLWNDFGMVQILHGRFWRHHKRQASPHSIRRHPYFFKTNATLLSSGLNFFFTLISWLAYYSCLRWATHTCLPRRSTIVESQIHTKITRKINSDFLYSSMTFSLFYAVKIKLR